jgi:hypothetical protein
VLHEGTKSEHEERYHLAMKKLNSFEMLPSESANEMYCCLNVLVEEVHGLGLTQMQPSDVVRKILTIPPIDKYVHIVMALHQGDLSATIPTQILGMINAHEMYMHITHQKGSSSSKKKDLAFKASQEKRSKAKIAYDSSSDDEVDYASLALMVRRTAKMLKKLNKNGVNFDGKKKKFFTSSRRKPISKMDCYNCGYLGHLAHQCPKPKKDKYKKKYKSKKDDSSDDDDEKKKNKPYKKKDGKKKEYHKKNGKAYIVGDWLTNIKSISGSSYGESENEEEKVAAFMIGSSLSPPPSPPSSSTHLCLMAKGERKVQNDDDSSGDDNA